MNNVLAPSHTKWLLRRATGAAVGILAALTLVGAGEACSSSTARNTLPTRNAAATAGPSAAPNRGEIRLTLPPTINAAEGSPIIPSAAIATTLPNFEGEGTPDGRGNLPVLAFDERQILVQSAPLGPSTSESPPERFFLLDLDTGSRRPLWEVDAGKQDLVTAIDADWVATVRVGQSLPFADWQVMLRNLQTGEVRQIAANDPRLGNPPHLPIGLPLGFAPLPAMHNGIVAWLEWYTTPAGAVHKRLRTYDVESRATRDLTDVADSVHEDIRSVSMGGNRIAWLHDRADWSDSRIVVRDVTGGRETDFVAETTPDDGKLSGDGDYFAWDVGYVKKYAVDLTSHEVVQFAADEGDQLVVAGTTVSWLPGSGPNARAGYYDFPTKTVRKTSDAGGGAANVLGHGWFFLREFTYDANHRRSARSPDTFSCASHSCEDERSPQGSPLTTHHSPLAPPTIASMNNAPHVTHPYQTYLWEYGASPQPHWSALQANHGVVLH